MKSFPPPYSGIWPALITPLDDDDRLDVRAALKLISRLIEQGAGGLYLCGSTGEAPLLRTQERKDFVEAIVSEVGGQLPIVVHVGHTSPAAALELAKHAARPGVDAISAVPPPFYGYGPEQVAGYWTTLSEVSGLPFIGYMIENIGGTREGMVRWVEEVDRVPRIAGVKFTNADNAQLAMLSVCSGGRWNLLAGYDQGYLAARAQGAHGAIGSTYNIALPLWRTIDRLHNNGDNESARRMMLHCSDLVARLTSCHFLTALRLVLKIQGFDCGLPRRPLRSARDIPAAAVEEIAQMIESPPMPLR